MCLLFRDLASKLSGQQNAQKPLLKESIMLKKAQFTSLTRTLFCHRLDRQVHGIIRDCPRYKKFHETAPTKRVPKRQTEPRAENYLCKGSEQKLTKKFLKMEQKVEK